MAKEVKSMEWVDPDTGHKYLIVKPGGTTDGQGNSAGRVVAEISSTAYPGTTPSDDNSKETFLVGSPGNLVATVTQTYSVDLSGFKDGTVRLVVVVDGTTDTFGVASTYYGDVAGSPYEHSGNSTLIAAATSATTGVDLPVEDNMCDITVTFASTGTDNHCAYVVGDKR